MNALREEKRREMMLYSLAVDVDIDIDREEY